jgi:hypothetical protein
MPEDTGKVTSCECEIYIKGQKYMQNKCARSKEAFDKFGENIHFGRGGGGGGGTFL